MNQLEQQFHYLMFIISIVFCLVTCIFLAVEMREARLPYHTYWILTAHVSCYVVAHVLLTVKSLIQLLFKDNLS